MTRKDLKILKKRLPERYTVEINNELAKKYSAIYIKKVLAGDRHNNEILIAAIKVAERNEATLKSIASAARGESSISQILEDNA